MNSLWVEHDAKLERALKRSAALYGRENHDCAVLCLTFWSIFRRCRWREFVAGRCARRSLSIAHSLRTTAPQAMLAHTRQQQKNAFGNAFDRRTTHANISTTAIINIILRERWKSIKYLRWYSAAKQRHIRTCRPFLVRFL